MNTPFLTKKEWTVLGLSTILSSFILSSIWWVTPNEDQELGYSILGSTIRVESTEGVRLAPFYTVFFTAYEANASAEEKQAVRDVLLEHVPRLHAYGDRHHEFLDGQGDPIVNLAILNDSYATNTWLAIDEPFYRLLLLGRDLTILTRGQFNMFLGYVSDFWDTRLSNPFYPVRFPDLDPLFNPIHRRELNRRLALIPMQEDEVTQTLELKQEFGQHYARFNAFNDASHGELLMSLGAIAKGFANDELRSILLEQNLTRGFISNGTSSITAIGPRYGNRPYAWKVASPLPSLEFAYTLTIQDRHALSTSGAYTGVTIQAGNRSILRHHIIDPSTGYPSTQAVEINLISTTYPAAGLDALSTAFMTMNPSDAMIIRNALIQQGYDLEIAWVEIVSNSLLVTHTPGYKPYLSQVRNVRYIQRSS
jgi:thiamine biosynthesis lipoprotein ApbE